MRKSLSLRPVVAILALLALLAIGSPALATGTEPAATEPVSEAKLTGPTETISLIIDEGQVLQLPSAATSVFVANPEIADVQVKSNTMLYLLGRAPGQTTFYAVDADDKIILNRTLVVGFNLGALRSAIRQLTGDDRVRVSQVQDMIMLGGKVSNASEAQDVVRVASRYLPRLTNGNNVTSMDDVARAYILNRLEIDGSNQVNIRVRIAEVNRQAIKTLGINSTVANPTLFGDVDMSLGFDPDIAFSGAAGSAALSTAWGATSLSTALDALVEDGMASLLAEPNLTALSGETASFLAGGEFPIPVPDGSGGFTIEFREFGVRLSFTPTVVSGSRISMRVRPEVSERDETAGVSFGGATVPGLTTRRTETSIELGSGQSFAIAGLLQHNQAQTVDKYPGLGDIPVLGALFRSDSFRRNETELVIVVTPYLVKPVSASQVMVPNDGYVAPNDIDRWLNGRLNSETPTPAPVPVARPASNVGAEGGLAGEVGFVVQ